MIRTKFFGLLPFIALLSCKEEVKKPNVIIILADDMGYSDLGCYGSEIETPALDSLAANGQRHTQFYTAGRSCPSRASLLTGLYPHQTGVGHMVFDDSLSGYRGYLNNNCKTIAEVLKSSGYNTYMSGKWHVGDEPQHWPRKRGFDRYFGLINGASSYYDNRPYRYSMKHNLVFALDDSLISIPDSNFYLTDAIGTHAIDFLKENETSEKPNPFFLYLAFTAPHWPLHALPKDIAKYKGKYDIGWDSLRVRRFNSMKSLGIIHGNAVLSPRNPDVPEWSSLSYDERENWSSRMEVYAAMIDRMDQNIARLISYLKETGEFDNTVIFFMSDNGACHESLSGASYIRRNGVIGSANSFDGYEKPWANVSNTPYQMFKHWTYEGGLLSPFIVHFPGVVQPGSIHNVPLHMINIMPTIIEIANAQYTSPSDTASMIKLPASSMMKFFENNSYEPETHQVLFWEHQGNRAFRKGNWKIVSRYNKDKDTLGTWELYNLGDDPVELINKADENEELLKLMIGWYEKDAATYSVVPYNKVVELRSQRKRSLPY